MRNEMMHRPVVKPELVDYLRTEQKQLPGELGQIQKEANEKGVPIIPHETVVFMQFLLGQLQPKKILEIGTAIGFSSSLMAQYAGEGAHVTTIDRFDVMIRNAKATYARLGNEEQITLLEGQAADIFPTLSGSYDFIFMDAAKGQYIHFLPEILRLLAKDGVLVSDNVLQDGDVIESRFAVTRRNRTIHKRMREYLYTLTHSEELVTAVLPVGDGITLSTRR